MKEIKLKKGQILTVEILSKLSHGNCIIDQDLNNGWFIIEDFRPEDIKATRRWLLERIGKCEYKKCDSACCKFVQFGERHTEFTKYLTNFGKFRHSKYGLKLKCKCKQLSRSGICKVWKTKKFPKPCLQFPLPSDKVYYEIFNKCSFKFKVIGELK